MKSNLIIQNFMQRIVNNAMGMGPVQEQNTADGERYCTPGISGLLRQCAAEGCVLLKNNGALPLKKEQTVSVFGRCQVNWFYTGYGSGGNVHPPYRRSVLDSLADCEDLTINAELAQVYRDWCADPTHEPDDGWWGHWPMHYEEMPVPLALARRAAKISRAAVVIIGRAAGEDRENILKKGSYYLTDTETDMLDAVTTAFDRVIVVINSGSIMDMAALDQYGDRISAILLAWQGGMESADALTDVLCGKVNPCGKLSATIAREYADYPSAQNFGDMKRNNYTEDIYVGYRYFETIAPEKVLYSFGFGLSYTTFSFTDVRMTMNDGRFALWVTVTNTGQRAGKEVAQLYARAPQGKLGKAARSLVAFQKTRLLSPGDGERVCLEFDRYALSSYDDGGKTGYRSAYVLEAGDYDFFVGANARAQGPAATFTQPETECVAQLREACAPVNALNRLTASGGREPVPLSTVDLRRRILEELPRETKPTADCGITLADVQAERASLNDFIAQLSDAELEGLTRGHGMMNSDLGIAGNAGALGGILPALREKGAQPVITTDGPSGIRIRRYTSLLPCGTALACTWNVPLIEQMFGALSKELTYYKVDMLLAPGMNIQRNPLCGRNFEYYSEDPVLTGRIAAAAVRGIQADGHSACPKHFACNNQEVGRTRCDQQVSERALREIYLKGFELCVREGRPLSIMTSYNKINGVWSHYNYDLVTTILRGEWGFDGCVVTDWWMRKSLSPEFPGVRDNAYRVRAQVDVLMPGNMGHLSKTYRSDGTLLRRLGRLGGITRGEIQRTASNVLRLCLRLKGSERKTAPGGRSDSVE